MHMTLFTLYISSFWHGMNIYECILIFPSILSTLDFPQGSQRMTSHTRSLCFGRENIMSVFFPFPLGKGWKKVSGSFCCSRAFFLFFFFSFYFLFPLPSTVNIFLFLRFSSHFIY